MSDDYIYAAARVHSRELTLLSRQDIDQLMACRSYEECVRVLRDKGWGAGEAGQSAEALLSSEEDKTWAFIRELTNDLAPFDVLLFPTDYNNLKAAVKCAATGAEPHHVFLPGGSIDADSMLLCAKENDFSSLPENMAAAASEAYHTLLQTGDGQLCDMILDRACLLAILDRGNHGGSQLLKQYAELLTATTDIKVAVRACKTGKSRAFLNSALVPCASLDAEALCIAACKDLESILSYLYTTPYGEAADRLKESYSSFEKWCDDKIMDLIREEKSDHFTFGPLFAYILARRNEIGTVRIILSGKLNELDDGMIRERLRELYV